MRIALINPTARRTQGYHKVGSFIPHLGLQVLARAAGSEHQVDVIDEIFGQDRTESLLSEGRYDLVGLTAYTSGATRAYELAGFCRSRGLPVVMGGAHASAVPDEVARYVDSVAVGECDNLWTDILADAAAGRLQPRYVGGQPDLAGLGRAQQSLQPVNGRYDVACLQTSRGCPVGCDFCSVTRLSGPQIRRRPIDEIIEEWNETPRKFIFVVDDNFFGVGQAHAEWAKQLLTEIIRRGKKRLWFSQTSINMGGDEEGLKLAYRAGCRGMLVGFETFNVDSLRDYHKGLSVKMLDRYQEMVDGFHRCGIAVFGGFIVGSDRDTEETVADTALQAVRLGVDIVQITNLTPLPGTRMYDRLMGEGRIFARNYPEDWERYTFVETIYNPNNVSARRLDETIFELRQAAAEPAWVWKRTLKTFLQTRSLTTALFVHGMNRGWARMAKLQVAADADRFRDIPRCPQRSEKIRRSFALRS